MTEERTEAERATSKDVEILSGTLVGLGIIALVQLLSVQILDVSLKISVFSFAVSIPSLSTVFVCMMAEARAGLTNSRRVAGLLVVFFVMGELASLTGISALFFHFSTYAGIIFIVVSLAGIVLWVSYHDGTYRTS